MTDLVTFGETMLRYSPPGDGRLVAADELEVHVGGAESNVAVAASRLGCDCVWLSRVADSPLGRHVTTTLRSHGVEPAVVWDPGGRQGTYYLESGKRPRGTDVFYDRADAAVTEATAEQLPTDHIESASMFHTSGITPALSETLAETTADLLARANEAGTTTSFDVNYRSKLWDRETARETLTPLLDAIDVLFVPARDGQTVMDAPADPEALATDLAETHDVGTVVVTRGSDGALAYRDGRVVEQPTYPASDAHPIGTGDAFVGGFLSEYVDGADLETALQWGAATAALKRAIPGDVALVSREEVTAVVQDESAAISR